MHPYVHSSAIYNSQVLETVYVPISKWVYKKTVVHLHNWIQGCRKKEGTSTFYDSMDGTGESYGKWNKPGGERQIPYDLSYKKESNEQNKLMSKTEPEA